MPRLGPVREATLDGETADLTAAEAIELVSCSGTVMAIPSAPVGGDHLDDCAWAKACPAP